ncbi:MAG TPA: serine/threonine-protein kinase, partial [Pyrinomonadaceae bacterium]
MIEPGTVLQNRYAVERQIGAGGMGAVYVATDRRFGSTVALKETFFDDPALRKAFEREARLLNRLRHHALPRVSDHFEEAEGQFLVMEYIPGEDLSQMLKALGGAGFPARQVLGWADQLLDALDYLHTQEPPVVHRDIKPQNLKLTARDQVVLLDFGLAKGTPPQTRATNTASLFGYSFNYAPIEQMQGAGTDPRSDLYSLGATLYHLLTGTTPPDALTRATAVLNGDPDPLRPAGEAAAHVPAEVSDVLARAMALSAARRFDSAEEMRAALREAARA